MVLPVILSLLVMTGFLELVFFRPARVRTRILRQAGVETRTVRSFAARFLNVGSIRSTAEQMSTDELLWAYYWPDHKAAAKAVIKEVLLGRDVSESELRDWWPPATHFTVPQSFARALTRSNYDRLSKLRSRWMQSIRIFAAIELVLIILLVVFESAWHVPDNLAEAAWPEQLAFFGNSMAAASYDAIYYGAQWTFFALLIGAIVGALAFRRLDRRVLLLRPFGEKSITGPLKRVTAKALGQRALVLTLSDRHYQPSKALYVLSTIGNALVAFVLNPLLRQSPRVGYVRNAKTYRKLKIFLLCRLRPSFWALLAGGQAFNLRSTDAWWKAAILTLMHSADAIVVDLTLVKAGTDWELGQIKARGLEAKTVYIAAQDRADAMTSALARYFVGGALPPVHTYDKSGRFSDERSLLESFEARLWGERTMISATAPVAEEARLRGDFTRAAQTVPGEAMVIVGASGFFAAARAYKRAWCGHCRKIQMVWRIRRLRVAQMFWVPVLPFGRHCFWECSECKKPVGRVASVLASVMVLLWAIGLLGGLTFDKQLRDEATTAGTEPGVLWMLIVILVVVAIVCTLKILARLSEAPPPSVEPVGNDKCLVCGESIELSTNAPCLQCGAVRIGR